MIIQDDARRGIAETEVLMKAVDLHVHSTFSDGTLSPEELVQKAAQLGLAAMALTDHDTVDGIDQAVMAASETNVELIPGIELSTFYDKKEIHIVGLYIDYTDKLFKKELENLKSCRERRNQQIAEKFTQLGIPVSYEEMRQMYAGAVITRAHFADYLVQKKYIKSRSEAFERYIGDSGPCYVPRRKMLPEEAISMIKSVGGVPILAHPVLYHLRTEQMNKLISYLCRSGIAGLEAIYSTYSSGEEIQMRKLAKENNLIISGGSDYHGANKPGIELGTGRGKLFVPEDVLDNIKKLRAKTR